MMLAALLCMVVVAALILYADIHAPAWTERGITARVGWPTLFSSQAALAFAVVPFLYSVWGTGPAVAGAAFVWLGTLAVATDLHTRKVPWDISHPVAAVGLVTFAFNYTLEGALALGTGIVGAVGVPLLARALTNKGLGMSDIRLLWAATATCSWWAGQTWLLYALIAACLLQMPVKLVCHLFNWGPMVPVHPDQPVPDDGEVAMRRELPFAPALVAAITIFVGYATYTAYGACLMWNVTGYCG
jgi:hypothetical protein